MAGAGKEVQDIRNSTIGTGQPIRNNHERILGQVREDWSALKEPTTNKEQLVRVGDVSRRKKMLSSRR
jgi:hypothetical protein